ncbi:nuclear transport factor 2 family protein [Parahaliea maris]|uniref:Nuclear transport factor 2 family protein n=1 Tax=Parahaliea maris TaxID=2716870 RepID=A0A5C9A602_9GAMM|nr:nuclear transport factor 2 family protein [Parahaliea maris]TXS95432.1 nuclear transport factor 2 family protein [Parahaliea maris]
MTIEETNKTIVTQFFDALNNGDVDAVVAAYSPDGCVQTMGSTLISGEAEYDQLPRAINNIFTVFPDGLRFTINGMVAEGDKVAVEAVSQGEHVSGQSYENDYHFLFEFRDGKLLRLKEYMDTEHVTDVLCGGQRPPFGVDD